MAGFEQGADAESPVLPGAFVDDLADADSFESLIQSALDWMPRLLDTAHASLSIINMERTALEVFAISRSGGAVPAGVALPIDGSLSGLCYRRQRAVRSNDMATADSIEADALLRMGIRSGMNVPLISGGTCHGSLNLGHDEPDFFTAENERRALPVARLLATFVRLYRSLDASDLEARTDELTGVLSRRAILAALDRAAEGGRTPGPVLYADLDDFKAINDQHGHQAGDRLLTHFATVVSTVLRSGDAIGRVGGDEFIVVCEPGTGAEAATKIAERIVDACTTGCDIGDGVVYPRVSVGVAVPQSFGVTAENLMNDADMALYEAKRTAQAVVTCDRELRRDAQRQTELRTDLDDAFHNNQMEFHYQPIVCMDTGEVLGGEALLRWTHPRHGAISPPEAVGLIEQAGLLHAFSAWTFETIASDLVELRRRWPKFADKAISLNLSAGQLGGPGIVNSYIAAVERHGLRTNDLFVEVGEGSVIGMASDAEQALRDLAAYGAFIALDDYGSGYNSLGYFARFPVHGLKFDRSFVAASTTHESALVVLQGLTNVCQSLGIQPVGEGIETQAELTLCRETGLSAGQGYLFGRPVPLEEFIRLLDEDYARPNWLMTNEQATAEQLSSVTDPRDSSRT